MSKPPNELTSIEFVLRCSYGVIKAIYMVDADGCSVLDNNANELSIIEVVTSFEMDLKMQGAAVLARQGQGALQEITNIDAFGFTMVMRDRYTPDECVRQLFSALRRFAKQLDIINPECIRKKKPGWNDPFNGNQLGRARDSIH